MSLFITFNNDVSINGELSVGKRSKAGITAIDFSTNITIDLSESDVHSIGVISNDISIGVSSIENGQSGIITFTVDSGGTHTIDLSSDFTAYDDANEPDASTAYITNHIWYAAIDGSIYYQTQYIS